MLFLVSLAAAADPPAWVEFDRRPAGWAESPYEYDARSVRRDGRYVRALYRYKFFYSGLPDPEYRVGIEIDCERRRSRVYWADVIGGPPVRIEPMRGLRPRRPNLPTIGTPIAAGSIEESLALRLCPRPAG